MEKINEDCSDITVGEIQKQLSNLDPALQLLEYAAKLQQLAAHWEAKYNGAMKLAKTVIDERDDALKAARELRDKLSKLGIV